MPTSLSPSYPVLPLRDIVVFPHMIVPLFVGREKSVRALEAVMKEDKQILLVAQKNAAQDDPSADDIYRVGTVSTILQLLKLPDGTVKVLVEGGKRARITTVKRTDEKFTTLRKSITPGTVLIMLAGRFRGRRVVALKQMPRNGPLVVTGPFKVNGVPLRRVNARYVIATSTKVDVAGVDTSKITNDLFKRAAKEKRVKGSKDFMGDKDKKSAEASATAKKAKSTGPNAGKVSDDRYKLQKTIDAALLANLKKDKEKIGYLRSVFTVKPGDMPHRMRF